MPDRASTTGRPGGIFAANAQRALHGGVNQQYPISLVGRKDAVSRRGEDRCQSASAAFGSYKQVGILHQYGGLPGQRPQ